MCNINTNKKFTLTKYLNDIDFDRYFFYEVENKLFIQSNKFIVSVYYELQTSSSKYYILL